MKNMKLNKSLLGLLMALALSACGKIPEAYRGDFQDAATGTKLKLESNAGILNVISAAGTREIKGEADDKMEFQSLVEGKPGVYLRVSDQHPDEMEVFFLFPRKETRKQEYDFAWIEAEILYTRMDPKREEKVQQFKMIHCEDGLLMLDLPTKSWNGGCPAGATEYDFVRTSEKK